MSLKNCSKLVLAALMGFVLLPACDTPLEVPPYEDSSQETVTVPITGSAVCKSLCRKSWDHLPTPCGEGVCTAHSHGMVCWNVDLEALSKSITESVNKWSSAQSTKFSAEASKKIEAEGGDAKLKAKVQNGTKAGIEAESKKATEGATKSAQDQAMKQRSNLEQRFVAHATCAGYAKLQYRGKLVATIFMRINVSVSGTVDKPVVNVTVTVMVIVGIDGDFDEPIVEAFGECGCTRAENPKDVPTPGGGDKKHSYVPRESVHTVYVEQLDALTFSKDVTVIETTDKSKLLWVPFASGLGGGAYYLLTRDSNSGGPAPYHPDDVVPVRQGGSVLFQVPKDVPTDNPSALVKYAEGGQRVDRVTNATEVGTIGDKKLIAIDTSDPNIKTIEELQWRRQDSNEIASSTRIKSFSYTGEVDEVQSVGEPVKGYFKIETSAAAMGENFKISVNAPGATPPTGVLYHKGPGEILLEGAGMTWTKGGPGKVSVTIMKVEQ